MLRLSLLSHGAIIFALTWSIQAPASTEPPTIEDAVPIPLAELGQRADAQQPAPAPVLDAGQATLAVPLQALRGEIGPDGLTVESTSASEGTGSFRITPTTLSKGGAAVPLASGVVSLRDQAVVLDRGPLAEILTASGDGLRQDFVVAQAPDGDGPLTLTLALDGATAAADPAGVALTLPGGRRLVYHRLHITDAAGEVLAGTLAAADAHTLTISVADAGARYPLTIDPTISDADWQVWNPGLPGADNSVFAIAYDSANGRLYVGGGFTAIGTVLANRIAQWDGSAWSALGSGLNERVYALAVSGSGDLYVGGQFTVAAGSAASSYIAQWNGSTWSALGSGLDDTVMALAVSGTGDLYVGGGFTTAGGNAAKYIAKWNGSTWSALGSGLNSWVRSLAVSGSDLYVGGHFTTAGGNTALYIAKWNGTAWSALGLGMDDTVYALAVSGSDLYVGGGFWGARPSSDVYIPTRCIAKWNGSTSAWSALGAGLNDVVHALVVSGSGDLYVGGNFTATQGGTAGTLNRIAKWNGSTWSALGSGADAAVWALAVSGSDLYAGGQFWNAGGIGASFIARWDDSNTWSAFGGGLNSWVYTLAVSDSDLYVGGYFTTIPTSAGNISANYIAQWNGSAWSALGDGLNGAVNTVALSGSDLYVGGEFTTAGGSPANYIAQWDGSAWSALGDGLNAAVNTVALSGSNVYVGGEFTTAGGSSANRIAQWNGSAWSALGSGLDSTVSSLAVSGTDLYVGGLFTTAGGITGRNRIAKWDGSTSTWSALGSGLDSTVQVLAVSGSDLYVGGEFTTAGGSPVNRIAKWNGSAWSALGAGLNDAVYALAVSGSDLYVGGVFTATQGGTAGTLNRIAAWDGSVWSALGSGLDDLVIALAVSGTGDLYVGGGFSSAGGKLSPYAAILSLSACGPGIPYTTGLWQQFAVPCAPGASPASIANVLGTGSATNLPTASYRSRWILYGRNAANSGNVSLASSATLAPAAGHWFKSLVAPTDGKLTVVGTATPVETGVDGCESTNGCAVVSVPTGSAAARMIGNPFPYNVEWSKVRVRVNSTTVYTPSEAFAATILNKQIWIWNGASYDTWDDDADPGNLQYFKSFFIRVLDSGVGQTIELLIPAESSTVPVSALPSDVTERLAAAPRSWLEGLRDWLIPAAAAEPAAETAPGWQVRLRVTNPKTGAKTRALLGQRPDAQPDYDPADLGALAPFASPYLTLVFPQPGWGTHKGDYASDFRPADGAPDQWNLELRSNPVGSRVMLRWEGDPATLARSRLTDRLTGQIIDPGDPAYADGYPLTLTTKVRTLSWEYFGD